MIIPCPHNALNAGQENGINNKPASKGK